MTLIEYNYITALIEAVKKIQPTEQKPEQSNKSENSNKSN